MYKSKYHKYKLKYLNLKNKKIINEGDDNDPDIIRYDDFEIIAHPESELPEDLLFDGLEDEYINSVFEPYKGSFEGFNETLNENVNRSLKIFGTAESAKGKIYDLVEFTIDTRFIRITEPSNKSKILLIDNVEDFDRFTEKYGSIFSDGNFAIRWSKVTADYKGIFIKSSALGARESDIPFKNTTVDNFIPSGFNNLDEIIIFGKQRDFIDYKQIDKPFKGKVIDPFILNEDEFVTIDQPTLNNKILVLDDVTSFDKFTNRYGLLKQINKINIVDINWDLFNMDYDGFYIPIDNDFFEDRYEIAFYKDNEYTSWLKYYNIIIDLVYIMD